MKDEGGSMKKVRTQKVGNIRFTVESNFKTKNADTPRERLAKIMLIRASNLVSRTEINKISKNN